MTIDYVVARPFFATDVQANPSDINANHWPRARVWRPRDQIEDTKVTSIEVEKGKIKAFYRSGPGLKMRSCDLLSGQWAGHWRPMLCPTCRGSRWNINIWCHGAIEG